MKNVQIIDGADNSVFEIYSVPDDTFYRFFPDGADIAFAEDFAQDDRMWVGFYKNRISKKSVIGIDGTLHLFGKAEKHPFFPSKKETDVQPWADGSRRV